MEYVFGEKSASYWWRVACIVGGLFLFAQLPLLFGKIDGEAGGFMVVGNTMGMCCLLLLIYLRPRIFTVTVSRIEVVIKDESQRVAASVALLDTSEVGFGRYGHVADLQFAWISLLETGKSKPKYFGPVVISKRSEKAMDDLENHRYQFKEQALGLQD